MNSIIEAQITLKEEQEKELERCKDPYYFFINYWKVKQFNIYGEVVDIRFINRDMYNIFREDCLRERSGWKLNKSSIEILQKYPLTPDECYMEAVTRNMKGELIKMTSNGISIINTSKTLYR